MRTDDLKTVPVVATFTGATFLWRWVAVSSNSLNPVFSIGSEGIAYRVLRRSYVRFEDIASVSFMSAPKTANLHFRFKTGLWTFSANVGDREAARRTIALLPEHLRFDL